MIYWDNLWGFRHVLGTERDFVTRTRTATNIGDCDGSGKSRSIRETVRKDKILIRVKGKGWPTFDAFDQVTTAGIFTWTTKGKHLRNVSE
jgi:hypothetical protein